MAANTTKTDSNISQLREQVGSGLSALDARATDTAGQLQLVLQARVSRLTRTAAALNAQYGPGDPAVKKAEAVAAAGQTAARRAAAVQEQLATPAPQVSPKGWALHGRVFDSGLQPLAAYTVFLVDAEKTFQRAFGFAYTDKTGYFLINYPGGNDTAAAAGLFVQVADANGDPVYVDSDPFTAEPSSATYQNIILPADGEAIGNPPAPVREAGLPGENR
ncbi:MAG TPA: hypothetical protein VG297_10700 [Bryobacteraceae bacterium]|jgi:hypothetical protein|nr:hypothetical protein [Bryobacteraceae bacterium]